MSRIPVLRNVSPTTRGPDPDTRDVVLEQFQGALKATEAKLGDILHELADISDSIGHLRNDYERLSQSTERAVEDAARISSADATKNRRDLSNDRFRAAGNLWEEFDEFYKRARLAVVTHFATTQAARDPAHREEAERIRDMLLTLFPDPCPEDLADPRRLETLVAGWGLPYMPETDDLARTARGIQQRAIDLRISYLWNPGGRRLDGADWLQEDGGSELWQHCEEGDPYAFVVRPAFLVDGRVVGRLQVFLGPPKRAHHTKRA
ncbi:hypothetical protein [Streptomyces sp. NPDC003077]|uniref:hypothetical protein n=1 Tax=Streptomyces sp. NPDC003077 TaxID=3154443 RepID=UPI0033B78435